MSDRLFWGESKHVLYRTILCILAVLTWIPCSLWGQSSSNFIRFSTAEGLPSNNITCLATDTEGFVWVGTKSGLARFDGQRFAAFRNLYPKSALPEESVNALFADQHGYLWVKFAKKLYRVSLATYAAVSYEEDLMPCCEDDAGNLYLLHTQGVVLFREQQGDFQYFPLITPEKNTLVGSICKGKNGLLLVQSSAGIFRFDLRTHTYAPLNALTSVAPQIYRMASDADGMLWLSVWYDRERGFIQYDPYQDTVLRAFSAEKSGITNTDLNDIYPDGENVWMATNSGGLCRYNIPQDKFYAYPANAADPGSLWNDQISRISKDHFGNLWVATPFFLFQLPAIHVTTQLLTNDPHNLNSLITAQGSAALELSNQSMAFGTLAGLSIFDREKHTFLNIRLPVFNDNTYNNQVICLANAENGSFWVATWSGLYRLDNRNGRILAYYITHYNAGLKHPESVKRFDLGTTRRMCKDRNGLLWRADFDNRITRLTERSAAQVFERLDTLVADANPRNDLAESFLDYDERYFLIGTFDGLVRYDRTQHHFENLVVNLPGLASPVKIESLARSKNGDILLIANGKPFRVHLDAAGATATALPLPGEIFQCQHILEDNTGSLWITTENGVARIDEAADFCWFYDSRHYLDDNIFLIRPSVLPMQDSGGNLYFGGSRGISVLRPLDFKTRKTPPPPVRIVALFVNDQPVVLDTAIHRITALQLPYYQNNLSFEFSALYSAIPARNRFAYRFDQGNWVDLGTQNKVNFSNLAPGTYVLQVKAANSDGVWNEEGKRLRITILPPWWRSWPAYLVYLVLVGFVLRRYLQFRERRLQLAHQLKTERQEADRLQELDAFKSRFFTNITHEFRTPLTVILGMSEQMENEFQTDQTRTTPVQLIRRNAQNLLRLINQLLDLVKVESNVLQLNFTHDDVLAYLQYIAESLHSYAHVRKVLVQVKSAEADIMMDYDPERLLQIVHNLLSNAIKFTAAGGTVVLRASVVEKVPSLAASPLLQFSVTDTGAGIPSEDLPYIFDRFYQAKNQEHNKAGGVGIGLALTQELVKLMGGSIVVESSPGTGSTFTVLLPITKNALPARDGHYGMDSKYNIGALNHPDTLPPRLMPKDIVAPDLEAPLPSLLLIEDNPDVVEYLRLCLAGQYQVQVAYNGRTGIEHALEIVPELIVSDVMMPEKDGFEVCDFLKNDERTSHIPIILLTARASVEDRIAGLRRGADAYMAKPFHREEFLVTVANLLQSRRVLQERLRNALETGQAIEAVADTLPVAPEERSVLEIEDVFVQKMRHYIEENIGNAELSMTELSRAMTMSYTNLHRKLVALTNLSPVQFIRLIRMQRAKVLLQTTRLSIADIAFEVGFSDPKYFSRVFTEAFGKSPSALRDEPVA